MNGNFYALREIWISPEHSVNAVAKVFSGLSGLR
jgi:hypothetical protein